MTSERVFEPPALKPGDVIEVRRRYVVTKRRMFWFGIRRIGRPTIERLAKEGTD